MTKTLLSQLHIKTHAAWIVSTMCLTSLLSQQLAGRSPAGNSGATSPLFFSCR
jgi:hypothetical protein